MRLMVGGCVYRNMVHTSHCASMVSFAARLTDEFGYELELCYRHSSNLPQGRSLWLRGALLSNADIAVTVDSDTGFDGHSLHYELNCLPRDSDSWAIAVAPVCRDTEFGPRINVYSSQGMTCDPRTMVHTLEKRTAISLWAGGFGLAAFNLHWFRKHWPTPFPQPFGKPEVDYINQGEDIQLCRSVSDRGGRIYAMFVPTVHYGVNGESNYGRTQYGELGLTIHRD